MERKGNSTRHSSQQRSSSGDETKRRSSGGGQEQENVSSGFSSGIRRANTLADAVPRSHDTQSTENENWGIQSIESIPDTVHDVNNVRRVIDEARQYSEREDLFYESETEREDYSSGTSRDDNSVRRRGERETDDEIQRQNGNDRDSQDDEPVRQRSSASERRRDSGDGIARRGQDSSSRNTDSDFADDADYYQAQKLTETQETAQQGQNEFSKSHGIRNSNRITRRDATLSRRAESETQRSGTETNELTDEDVQAQMRAVMPRRTTAEQQQRESLRRYSERDVLNGAKPAADDSAAGAGTKSSAAAAGAAAAAGTARAAKKFSARDTAKAAGEGVARKWLDTDADSESDDWGIQSEETTTNAIKRYAGRRLNKRLSKNSKNSPTVRKKATIRGQTTKKAAAATNDSVFYQNQAIQKKYFAALNGGAAAGEGGSVGALLKSAGTAVKGAVSSAAQSVAAAITPYLPWIFAGIAIIAIFALLISSCTAIGSSVLSTTAYSSFTAETEDILDCEEYYTSLENSLWSQLQAEQASAEAGGEYYRVDLKTNGGVGHNPWKLAAILTVLYEDYKLNGEVKSFLNQLFNMQYSVSYAESTEIVEITTKETYQYVSSTVNIRSGAGTTYDKVGTLAKGTEVTILESKTVNGVMWYRIGTNQWIFARYVKSDEREVTTSEEVTIYTITLNNYTLDGIIDQLSGFDSERYNLLIEYYGNRYDELIQYEPFKEYSSFGVASIAAIPETTEEIWNYLMDLIGNEYGVAGLIGNLYCESGLLPNNLQDTYNQSLGYDDEGYTSAVDSGIYSNFTDDSAGYGLAQWTDSSRKTRMYNFWKDSGASSISSLQMQLDYLAEELQTNYSKVLSVLKSATSVREASDAVLISFERPAGYETETKQASRASYGECFYNYNKYGIIASGTLTKAQRAVVYVAYNEVQYWDNGKKSLTHYTSPQGGYCLKWACAVVSAATGVQGGGCCAHKAKDAYSRNAINYDFSVIPVGAAVFTADSGSGAGGTHNGTTSYHSYGHVGIYIGNGVIAECIKDNNVNLTTVEKWQSSYSDASWGWLGYADLSDEYANYVSGGIPIS